MPDPSVLEQPTAPVVPTAPEVPAEKPVSEMSREEIIAAVEGGEPGDYEGEEAAIEEDYFQDELLPDQPEEEMELLGPPDDSIQEEPGEEGVEETPPAAEQPPVPGEAPPPPPPAASTEQPDDPYAFIKENTPFQNDESIVEGYKNIQSLSTKQALEIKDLKEKLEGREVDPEEDDLSEIPLGENVTVGQLKELVTELVADQSQKQNMEKEQVDFEKHLDSCYDEAMAMEGFNKKVDVVYGIVNHDRFADIVGPHIKNPYKIAFELASNPNIMRLYNQYPDLLKMKNGGLDVANQMVASLPSDQIIKSETKKAVKSQVDQEIQEINSSVAEPSAGGGPGEKPVSEMTRDEVFEAVGVGPDDIS